jgi:hypothetical protein
MNVDIGAEAALFQEKEYINVIAVEVCRPAHYLTKLFSSHAQTTCTCTVKKGLAI